MGTGTCGKHHSSPLVILGENPPGMYEILKNNGRFYISTGAGVLPSTVLGDDSLIPGPSSLGVKWFLKVANLPSFGVGKGTPTGKCWYFRIENSISHPR